MTAFDKYLWPAVVVVGAIVVLQLLRYQYVVVPFSTGSDGVSGGVIWRFDRLTGAHCIASTPTELPNGERNPGACP